MNWKKTHTHTHKQTHTPTHTADDSYKYHRTRVRSDSYTIFLFSESLSRLYFMGPEIGDLGIVPISEFWRETLFMGLKRPAQFSFPGESWSPETIIV